MLVTITNITDSEVVIPNWDSVLAGTTRVFTKTQDEIDVIASSLLRFIKKGWVKVDTVLDEDSSAINASPLARTGVVEGMYLTLSDNPDNSTPENPYQIKINLTPGFFRVLGTLIHAPVRNEYSNPYYVDGTGALVGGFPVMPEGTGRMVSYIAYGALYGPQNQHTYHDILTVFGPERPDPEIPLLPTQEQLVAACVADYSQPPRAIVKLAQSFAWRFSGHSNSDLDLRVRTFTR